MSADVEDMRTLLVDGGARGPFRLVVSPALAERARSEGWEMPFDVQAYVPTQGSGNRAERRKLAALQRSRRGRWDDR